MITMTIKGVNKLRRDVKKFDRHKNKALEFVIRRQGFQLRDALKDELKDSKPGGQGLKRLSYIARGLNIRTSNRLRKNTPLARLRSQVFYDVDKAKLQAKVGFVEGRTHPFLRRMAKLHSGGFERTISPRLRQLIIRRGARRLSGHRDEEFVTRTPFFIKKTTTRFKTPARPIIEPFWDAHRHEAITDIRKNFIRKMRGERI